MKPHFKYWLDNEYMDRPEPIFGLQVATGVSDVSGETVLAAGFPLPLFPSVETWRREVLSKRRCGRCWAAVRGHSDLERHSNLNHLRAPIYLPAVRS